MTLRCAVYTRKSSEEGLEQSFNSLDAQREERGLAKDGLLLPREIAETYFHSAHQHRLAWTHELDLRPYSDLAWWNHRA